MPTTRPTSSSATGTYTNNKVIVARVFTNKVNQNGFDAEPVQEHGTHVAGTIACNFDTPATVDGAAIPFGISGVAPRALLGSYNIFPGNIEDARSEDILNALEAAYRDGMDIVNMSLGGGAHGVQDLLTVAVDNLDQANMISAVAAGNSGPGSFTVESPGSAARALTAGASSVNHSVTNPVTAGAASAAGVLGDFGKPSYPFGGTLRVLAGDGVSGLSLACDPLAAAASADSIALIQRGVCDFSLKLYNVQQAGYAAAIVVNRIDGPPIAMGKGVAPDRPDHPRLDDRPRRGRLVQGPGRRRRLDRGRLVHLPVLRRRRHGRLLERGSDGRRLPGQAGRRRPGRERPVLDPHQLLRRRSVLRVLPGHVHGDAAPGGLGRDRPPGAPGLARLGGPQRGRQHGRHGRPREVHARRRRRPTSTCRAPGGSTSSPPPVPRPPSTRSASASVPCPPGPAPRGRSTVRILNTTGAPVVWSVGIAPNGGASGVTFSTSVSSVSLAAGASTTFTVKATFAKAASTGSKQAWLAIGGGAVAHAAVFALVK